MYVHMYCKTSDRSPSFYQYKFLWPAACILDPAHMQDLASITMLKSVQSIVSSCISNYTISLHFAAFFWLVCGSHIEDSYANDFTARCSYGCDARLYLNPRYVRMAELVTRIWLLPVQVTVNLTSIQDLLSMWDPSFCLRFYGTWTFWHFTA